MCLSIPLLGKLIVGGDVDMSDKKELNIEIGKRIRIARDKARVTQEALAEYVEVSPQFVSDLERGVVGVSVETLRKICAALCVSSDKILFGNESEPCLAAVLDKCRGLPQEQMAILCEIIDNFVKAVKTEK